jgi:hypothetical protein
MGGEGGSPGPEGGGRVERGRFLRMSSGNHKNRRYYRCTSFSTGTKDDTRCCWLVVCRKDTYECLRYDVSTFTISIGRVIVHSVIVKSNYEALK